MNEYVTSKSICRRIKNVNASSSLSPFLKYSIGVLSGRKWEFV